MALVVTIGRRPAAGGYCQREAYEGHWRDVEQIHDPVTDVGQDFREGDQERGRAQRDRRVGHVGIRLPSSSARG